MSPSEPVPVALIVEDNADNMLLTRAVLRRAGYQAVEAHSAEEALEQLGNCTPDLVLMDIQLPGRDGLSLTRELRTRLDLADTPIIALSAHAMADNQVAAADAGCDGYITKPIDTRTFGGQLAAALEARKSRSAAL